MIRQGDLFGDDGAPFQRHSDTSRQAAEEIEQSMNRLQMAVYAYLVEHGPATDEMMQLALNMNPSTQRPRRIELVNRGSIKDTGQRALTRSGRHAVLWAAVKTEEK